MPNELAERGILARLSLLCQKIISILLKYGEGERLTEKERKTLLRGKELILDKIIKAAKLCEGEQIENISDLWEGIRLYGYALVAVKIFENNFYFRSVILNSTGFKISNFFVELSVTINNISTCREPICSGVLARIFFEEFEKQIRPRRILS